MTLSTDFASWKQKLIEATDKLKLNLDDEKYQTSWGVKQRVATENMNKFADLLRLRPWTDELEAEEIRAQKAKAAIFKKWENRVHPVVTAYDSWAKARE